MKTEKPMPENYGLFGDINTLEQLLEAKAANEHKRKKVKHLLLNLIISSMLAAIGIYSDGSPKALFYIGMLAIVMVLFFELFSIKDADGKDILEKDQTYQNIQKYKKDMKKYEQEWATAGTIDSEPITLILNNSNSQSAKPNKNSRQVEKFKESTSKINNLSLNEAAYMKARAVHNVKIFKALILWGFFTLLLFYGYAKGKAWSSAAIIPVVLATLLLLFIAWLRPVKDNPGTYESEIEFLLHTDDRFIKEQKSKWFFEKEAYIKARKHTILMTLSTLGLFVVLSFIASSAVDKDKWFLVFAMIPALWSFIYLIALFFAWPSKDDSAFYKQIDL